MILWTSVPGYMGFGYTQQLTNIGELDARGYEMVFKYRDVKGEFRYEFGFNLSSVAMVHKLSGLLILPMLKAIWRPSGRRFMELKQQISKNGMPGPLISRKRERH